MDKSNNSRRMAPVSGAILLFLAIQVVAMLFLSLFRIGFIAYNMPEGEFRWGDTLHALRIGLQFDGLIVAFLTAIPFLIVCVSAFFNIPPKRFKAFVNSWYFPLFSLILILTAADIPYFSYFNDHLTIQAFGWFSFLGDTLGLLFGDWHNYVFLLCIGLAIFAFVKVILIIEKKTFEKEYDTEEKTRMRLRRLPLFLIYCAVLFLLMRGTFERYPLRIGISYFCDEAFYNRVGIAPTFNIIESLKTKDNSSKQEIDEIDVEKALDFVKNELSIANTSDGQFPLTRTIKYEPGEAKNYNIVIVLLESLTSIDLDWTYDNRPIMPYLSGLRSRCLYFPQFYSAAIHTNCGITASLYGYAPNFGKPTMNIPSDIYHGLPHALKEHGYHTMFFITGNPQYDRMNSFLYDNAIEKIYSQYDYPADKIANNFGVQDDYLLEYGFEELTRHSKTGKPFFATFLTVSNHPPYIVPEEFENRGKDDHQKMLAFVDNSVKNFIEKATQSEWGKNTIFVLLGDHGYLRKPQEYDMSLTYNHIPCFIITPDKQTNIVNALGGQIDLYPTLMGMLRQNYTNNTLGIDLFNQKREYIYFVNDNQIGCTDSTYFYCYNFNSKKGYLYKIGDGTNILDANKDKAEAMRRYCFSMMSVSNTAVRNGWTKKKDE